MRGGGRQGYPINSGAGKARSREKKRKKRGGDAFHFFLSVGGRGEKREKAERLVVFAQTPEFGGGEEDSPFFSLTKPAGEGGKKNPNGSKKKG